VLLLAGGLLAVSAAIPGAAVVVLTRAFDGVTSAPEAGGLAVNAALFAGLYALGAVVSVARTAVTKRLAWRVTSKLRQQLHAAYLTHRPGATGARLAALTTEVDELQYGVSAWVTAVRNPLTLLILGGTATVLAPQLVVWAVALLVPLVLVTWWGGRRIRTLAAIQRDARAALIELGQQQLLGLRTIHEHAAERGEARRFAQLDLRDRDARVRLEIERVLPRAVVQALTAAAVGMLLWLGGSAVEHGDLAPSSLVGFIVALGLMSRPLSGLSEVWGLLQRSLVALERVYAALEALPAVAVPESPRSLPEGALAIRWGDVHAGYDNNPVLTGIDLIAGAGELMGIVGPTGSGKSTLLRLVGRHLEPTDGIVEVGGVDVRDVDPAQLRTAVAVVDQEVYLFARTVGENLTLGHPEATPEDVARACAIARVDGLIAGLDKGLDTPVAELGRSLSGGERQRLALARALVGPSSILLLDEPTNQLDAETEKGIVASIAALRGERTVVMVAHHLIAVAGADRIVFVDQGRVVESGSHPELMARGGRYASLWTAQHAGTDA
jgi:ATP-binding cassette subfamily B protein